MAKEIREEKEVQGKKCTNIGDVMDLIDVDYLLAVVKNTLLKITLWQFFTLPVRGVNTMDVAVLRN